MRRVALSALVFLVTHPVGLRRLIATAGSVVCLALFLTFPTVALGQGQFAGVYTGIFSGPRNIGRFAVLVRTNNVAIVMAFDAFDELGFVNQNVTINPNGSFAKSNIDGAGTFVSGIFTDTEVTGTFVDQNGTGTLNGTKQPGNGFARNVGGFYAGGLSGTVRFNGDDVGTFSGDWFMLIAANGQLFSVFEGSVSAQGETENFEVGGPSAVSSVGELCQSVSLDSASFTCTFDPNTFTFSGTFFISDSGITISGTFSLTRRVPLPDLPPVAVDDVYAVFANRSLTATAAEGVLSNDSDPEEDPLTAVLITGPTQGSVSLSANGAFTYTPNPKFLGMDSFTYRAQARSLQSNIATVTITVKVVAMPWLYLLLLDD